MDFTKNLDEFAEACSIFQSAVMDEKELVRNEELFLAESGRSRSEHIALQYSQSSFGRQYTSETLLDNPQAIVETVSIRQRELEALRLQCEVFVSALDDVRNRRMRAATTTALAASTLRKQAMELLEARYGKRRWFSWWTDEREQVYVWRRSVLWQLLALASRDAEDACRLLRYFFREDEGFALHVRRGFRIASGAGFHDIKPTESGQVCEVPKDLPAREAFESVLAGRAELVASMA